MEFLRTLRFTWTKIAQILGISRATLYRRLEEEDVNPELWYSDISDHDLDTLIAAIKHDNPNDGDRLMAGHLCSRSVFVPRSCLRGSIHCVDTINTALRRSVTACRRCYHAEGPNYIRSRLVIVLFYSAFLANIVWHNSIIILQLLILSQILLLMKT